MTVNDELERAQKEAVVPVLKHYPYPRETKNNHKKKPHNGHSFGQNSNLGPPQCEESVNHYAAAICAWNHVIKIFQYFFTLFHTYTIFISLVPTQRNIH